MLPWKCEWMCQSDTRGDRVAGAASWGAGRWHWDLGPGVHALELQVGSYWLLLAPVEKQDLGQSVRVLYPLFPVYGQKDGSTYVICYIPGLGGFSSF